jgi:hypothetical protein
MGWLFPSVVAVATLFSLILGVSLPHTGCRNRMEFGRFTDLAAELQLWIARAMGVDAMVNDWIEFEKQCSTWSVPFGVLLTEWLSKREAGVSFGEFGGGKEEDLFVMQHIQGKQGCVQVAVSCANSNSVYGKPRVGDIFSGLQWRSAVLVNSRDRGGARCLWQVKVLVV